jgi:hypothetical protein
MPSALFLLKLGNGREQLILEEISHVPGVTCAYPVTGYYDAVVIAQAYTEYELKWTIANKIKHLDGVTSFVALLERCLESVAASA